MSSPAATLDAAERVGLVAERCGHPVLVIGAMALAAHGYIRATNDIDLALNASLAGLRALAQSLASAGFAAVLHEPDADDPLGGVIDVAGDFGLVQLVNFGNRFPAVIDEALQGSPLALREGSPLRLIPLPHLIALKLYAGGRKSARDIVELLEANPGADVEQIRRLCARFRLRGFDALLREAGTAE